MSVAPNPYCDETESRSIHSHDIPGQGTKIPHATAFPASPQKKTKTTKLVMWVYHYVYLTDGETGAQRDEMTCPRSQGLQVTELAFEPRSSGPASTAFSLV